MAVSRRSVRRRASVTARIDAAFFAFAGLAALWLALLTVLDRITPGP